MPTKKSTTKKAKKTDAELIPAESIEQHIYTIRGHRVMLDSDLASLYEVATRVLNQAVKRNLQRFPEDFMIQLTFEEANEIKRSRSQSVTLNATTAMRSQSVTASTVNSRSQFATLKRGENVKYAPNAFTEHGAVMLATILNSPIAIEASVQVVRAFVRLRSILAVHAELAKKLEALEKKTDANFKVVYDLINKYLQPPAKPKSKIGF